MTKRKKTIVILATVALVGSLGAAGLLIRGAADASADPASNSRIGPPPVGVTAAIVELEKNIADLTVQQASERREAARSLELPPGAEFGPEEPFDALELQIAAYESLSDSVSAVDAPTLEWYEDGYFASLMAIDWRCAWVSTGVRDINKGDLKGAEAAVKELHDFASTPYASAFPDYDVFLDDVVDPMLEGETGGAYSWLPNCLDSTRVD